MATEQLYTDTGAGAFSYGETDTPRKGLLVAGKFRKNADGKVACNRVYVYSRDREPITGKLGTIDLDAFVARAADFREQREHWDALNAELLKAELFGGDTGPDEAELAPTRKPRKIAKRRELTVEFLREVAKVHADANPRRRTQDVADHYGVKNVTAQAWVDKARTRGLTDL